MKETKGLLERIRHHDELSIALNEDCKIPLPEDAIRVLMQPHRLSFYYFQYIERGSATFTTDVEEFTVSSGGLAFGQPNQIFTKLPYEKDSHQYALSFDEQTLRLLPVSYSFLIDPANLRSIAFDPAARLRVNNLLSGLFQLLHGEHRQKGTEIILAHLHALLTEFDAAYAAQHEGRTAGTSARQAKYIEFKLAVETGLTEQHDVKSIADKLLLRSSTLYGIVKEFAGVSPKEWILNRLMLEAQRRLQYSSLSVKELAYELGFADPGYFSRLFRKSTGKSVTRYRAEGKDLSRK